MTDDSFDKESEKPVSIEQEMERSYLDYAMSVIVARALPDSRDGLKPGQRRILYAMKEAGYDHSKAHRKSARIVGDVMGKYHPHGGDAIYESMVRMAQDFSLRLPLIDGQGNFGSMDGDPAAAMRYTEARLARSAGALIEDIDKDTVDFRDNYDGSHQEPEVLPAQFPHLLVNGAGGVAVGMATNIPPHNVGEVIDACCYLIDTPMASVKQLMGFIKGPDFPTGGIILGKSGILSAYQEGRGLIRLRAKCTIEPLARKNHAIIVKEIPYQVNKARLIERIAELARNKAIVGITDLRDESDREGVRIVIEVKRDADARIVLHRLYQKTPLQVAFSINMLALKDGRPQILTLAESLRTFLSFRRSVVARRTAFLLARCRKRAHELLGFRVALDSLDDVISIIRQAKDAQEAATQLCQKTWDLSAAVRGLLDRLGEAEAGAVSDKGYRLSPQQAKAILELRLQRLTGLERDKISSDLEQTCEEIVGHLTILNDSRALDDVVRKELMAVKERFATPRLAHIGNDAEEEVLDEKDLVQSEDLVITLSHKGYIKRVPRNAYRAQRRGGKGRSGMKVGIDDAVVKVWDANTRMTVLFFSSLGQVYSLVAHELPEGTPQSKGRSMMNILPLAANEYITSLLPLPEDESQWQGRSIVFATAQGMVRRNQLSDFTKIMAKGKKAMKLKGDDELVGVAMCNEKDDLFLATRRGQCIRFAIDNVRIFSGRDSSGVRGITLAPDDRVMSLALLPHCDFDNETRYAWLRQSGDEGEGATLSQETRTALAESEVMILTLTDRGLGKCTSSHDYRLTGRGGKGITNIALPANKPSSVVATFTLRGEEDIILMSEGGMCLRMPTGTIRRARRSTQGVQLLRLDSGEKLVSAAVMTDESTQDKEEQGD
ncbi:MAG: DNA gyrase subunit A [Alphaproteobacteria bacterium GM202ARS2]|nr:DNA gyrase subunit A [Alphaproteobacteria bacterium GM202ARS2]